MRRSNRLLSTVLMLSVAFSAPSLAAEPKAARTPQEQRKLTLNANDNAGIAIVVNDSAITNGDIVARYRMALLSSGLPDSPDNRSRIMPQIVRGLIEEQLQLQETRRQQIDVTDGEISEALNRMAQESRVPGGDLRAYLKSQGIAPQSIELQTRANIAWAKLIQRQLRPRVEISDDEVEDVVARLKANAGKMEYFVNEIFLPIEDAAQDSAVNGFANKLLQQIKQTGAFGAIARQFSQGAGAPQGGEIGWVQQGTLAPELDAALQKSAIGTLVGPVKTRKGYHILAVRDARKITASGDSGTKVKLAQIARGVQPQMMKAALGEAKAKIKDLSGCATLEKDFPAAQGWQVRISPEQALSDMPSHLAPIVRSLKVGAASDFDIQPQGFGFIVVCERTESGGIDRMAIYNAIGSERLENLARGMLRDLKRTAFIDMRI